MVKKIIEQYVSDLSGVDVPDSSGSLKFAFDGRSYEIDLTESERAQFEAAIKPYTAVARPAQARSKSGRAGATGSSTGGVDPKLVRTWAREHGHQVPDRGRIPAPVVEAYHAAH